MSIHTRNEMEEEDRDDTATWTLYIDPVVRRNNHLKREMSTEKTDFVLLNNNDIYRFVES